MKSNELNGSKVMNGDNTMNEVRVFCPNCGTQFAIENKCKCEGKPKALEAGDYFLLPKSGMNKDMLAQAGFDTDTSAFSLNLPQEEIEKMVNGSDDPVILKILSNGRIESEWLFRRWVMAQTFRMLGQDIYHDRWNDHFKYITYQESLKLTIDEIRRLEHMERKGGAWFNINKRFYSLGACQRIFIEYWNYAQQELMNVKADGSFRVHGYTRCVSTAGITDDWINHCKEEIADICNCHSYKELLENVEGLFWSSFYVKLPNSTRKSDDFVNAYKGVGGYFTMDNMIHSFKCFFPGMNEQESAKYLEEQTLECIKNEECYRLLGILKQFIKDTGFDYGYELDKRHGRVE